MIERRTLLAGALAAGCGQAFGASLVELIARGRQSICAIGTYRATDSPRFAFRGSGFLIGDGSLVATCAHVLPETTVPANAATPPPALAVLVGSGDGNGTAVEGEVVASERTHDLAIIRVKRRLGTAVELGPPALPPEGTEVALMGFPIGSALGFRPVTHRGIVAAVVASSLPTVAARQLNSAAVFRLREGKFELLQLDATAYPGNSGGPLFDSASGQVVGVVSMVAIKGQRESALSQPTGITYAVPVRHLRDLLATL